VLAVLFALKARTSGYNYSAEKDPFASADVSAMIATVIELFTNVESVTVKQEILRAIPAMMKVQVMRQRDAYRRSRSVTLPQWAGTQRTIEALPVLRQAVGNDLMLRSGVIDIAQQLMLVTRDHSANYNVAGPLIVEGLTSPEAKSNEGLNIREATLALWRSMLIVAPPIEMVDPLFPYAIALLGPDTVITAKEVPQAIHICIDFMVLGSVEYVRAHGEEFVSATVAIMQSSDEPDIYRRLVVARAINVLLPVVRAEAAKLLWPLYLASFFKPDGTASSFWEQPSFRNELCSHWIRLAYLQPEHLCPVIQQLAQSVPPALASEEKFTFQGIIKEMCTMLSRCMHCGVRLMATLVVSGLLLKVPSEPALQPLVGNLLSLCVELLSKALEPAQLKRTLWQEASYYPKDERERQLLLCGVAEVADSIPGQVMNRLKEFANAVGQPAFEGLVAAQKPTIAEKLGQLFNQYNAAQSPTQSPLPSPGLLTNLPASPLPAPAISQGPSGFTL